MDEYLLEAEAAPSERKGTSALEHCAHLRLAPNALFNHAPAYMWPLQLERCWQLKELTRPHQVRSLMEGVLDVLYTLIQSVTNRFAHVGPPALAVLLQPSL